jgi:hypothetical protein
MPDLFGNDNFLKVIAESVQKVRRMRCDDHLSRAALTAVFAGSSQPAKGVGDVAQ